MHQEMPQVRPSEPRLARDDFVSSNVTMRDGRVNRVNYSGPTEGLLTPDEQCAFAVQHCTR